MKKCKPNAAFTLSELTVSTAVAATVLVTLFTLMNTMGVLSATNVSINETHFAVRRSIDKVLAKVSSSAGAPDLVDANGASVSGNGPAEGMRCLVPKSSQAYPIAQDADGTDTEIEIKLNGLPAPQAGDVVLMTDIGFQGTVASVSNDLKHLTLTTTVGNCFSPAKRAGTVVSSKSKCFIYSPTAFISVGNVLRYYPRALSVATDGATAFNNEANFLKIATLVPLTGNVKSSPFQYLDSSHRSIDVSLRINAPAYSNRVRSFNKFLSVRTTAAFRSASLLRAN